MLALVEQQDREDFFHLGNCAEVWVRFHCETCDRDIHLAARPNISDGILTDEIRTIIAAEIMAVHRQQHEKEDTPKPC